MKRDFVCQEDFDPEIGQVPLVEAIFSRGVKGNHRTKKS